MTRRSPGDLHRFALTIAVLLTAYFAARWLLGPRRRHPETTMILIAIAAAAAVGASTLGIDPSASVALAPSAADHAFGECHFGVAADGMPLPDPKCTPGAVNPTLTVRVLTDPGFRTGFVRDKVTSPAVKRKVYAWYGIIPPRNNVGANQTCELDHLDDLGAGGADTLNNLWPQCQRPGDPPVPVGQRWFKIKDANAEHVMIAAIKRGISDAELAELQKRMAADWTSLDKAPEKASPAPGVSQSLSPVEAE